MPPARPTLGTLDDDPDVPPLAAVERDLCHAAGAAPHPLGHRLVLHFRQPARGRPHANPDAHCRQTPPLEVPPTAPGVFYESDCQGRTPRPLIAGPFFPEQSAPIHDWARPTGAAGVEDEVVPLSAIDKVLPGVVSGIVSADRSDQVAPNTRRFKLLARGLERLRELAVTRRAFPSGESRASRLQSAECRLQSVECRVQIGA